MITSAPEAIALGLEFVRVGSAMYVVVPLKDGRIVSTPLDWYPSLAGVSASSRAKWTLIAGGRGVSWPELDIDLSVEGMLSAVPELTRQARAARPVAASYASALRRLVRAGCLAPMPIKKAG